MDAAVEVEVAATIKGLGDLAKRMKVAGYFITDDAIHAIQKRAVALAPQGEPGNTTNPPGDLKSHIATEGPKGTTTRWVGKVGPAVVSNNRWAHNYGGQREFGGTITAHNPSGHLFFKKFDQWYSPVSVKQTGAHYLLRARIFAIPTIKRSMIKRLTEAIVV
jgi:hypothetical protein